MKLLLQNKYVYYSDTDKATLINNIKDNINQNKIQKLYDFSWKEANNFELTIGIGGSTTMRYNSMLYIKCDIEKSTSGSILYVQIGVRPGTTLFKNLVLVFLICIGMTWYTFSANTNIFELGLIYLFMLAVFFYLPMFIGFNMELYALRNTLEKAISSKLILKN